MLGIDPSAELSRLAKPAEAEPGDYIGPDGFLYCGKCNTKKECVIKWPGKGMVKVSAICKCRSAEMEARKERERHEEELRRIERARISSMMDETFRNATLENFKEHDDNRRYLKVARNYCDNFEKMYERNQGLLFYGSVGTGKSYTAACIANHLLNQGQSVVMTSFVKILQEMQGFDREREEAFVRRLNNVRLLIIDDFGAERSTDYALEKIYGIIDNRYRARKPLILTTNLELEQMQTANDIRYARIYDRVFEICYPLKFVGQSWRKREAAQRYEETRKILEA